MEQERQDLRSKWWKEQQDKAEAESRHIFGKKMGETRGLPAFAPYMDAKKAELTEGVAPPSSLASVGALFTPVVKTEEPHPLFTELLPQSRAGPASLPAPDLHPTHQPSISLLHAASVAIELQMANSEISYYTDMAECYTVEDFFAKMARSIRAQWKGQEISQAVIRFEENVHRRAICLTRGNHSAFAALLRIVKGVKDGAECFIIAELEISPAPDRVSHVHATS